jgi:hypothetical protein
MTAPLHKRRIAGNVGQSVLNASLAGTYVARQAGTDDTTITTTSKNTGAIA